MPLIIPSTTNSWQFLGKVILGSAAVRTPLLSWTGAFQQLMFEHFVSGYNGGAIARLIVGPAGGLSETGTTFNGTLIDTVGVATGSTPTTTNTSVGSIPGWPLAGGSAAAVRRHGYHWVKNVAAEVKTVFGHGNYAGTAPTTGPSNIVMSGMFNDTTNLIQQAELAVYASNTTTAVSTTTMNVGSYLIAWGRNNN